LIGESVGDRVTAVSIKKEHYIEYREIVNRGKSKKKKGEIEALA